MNSSAGRADSQPERGGMGSTEESVAPKTPGHSWGKTFAALKYPNYRLWFWGQMVSLFGTWMQTTAQGFLIYELTRSPVYLGYVGFASGIPTWLLTLYGGVVADRVPRRTLMIFTQTCMMILAFVLAGLTFFYLVQPWHVIALAALLGVANSFDAPARQAFVSEMVAREDLTNAIALNATMFNTATAVGPAVAGVVYALFGPEWCFTINGLSFVAVIMALQMMKLQPLVKPAGKGSAYAEFKEGIRYVVRHPVIRVLISMVAITSMLATSLSTLVPAWSVNVLGGGAAVNGLLLSARGFGSLLGALTIATLGRFTFRGKLLTFGSLMYPLLFFAFAFVRWLPLSLLVLAGAGMGMILVMNLANALVQTSTPDHLRGRVMGAYTWIFFGFMPIGALWTGTVAQHIGEPQAVIINAVAACAFAIAVFALFPKVRTA
jgi:MFS family permease